jgi:hypothetical protein
MMELINVNQEVLNTKDKVRIDLIKDGQEFLEDFEINHEFLLRSVSIIYRYLSFNQKIPNNLFKFFIAAYYIVTRHPRAFPAHDSKKKFCRIFGIQQSSLEYCVDKIIGALDMLKILDDKNFPYFIDRKSDVAFKLAKSIVKFEVEKASMNFMLYHQPINSQILTESIITELIFEMKIFPEELFRQFYDIILEMVDNLLIDYNQYVKMQEKYFI